jgi:serine/threonine-protein kinase
VNGDGKRDGATIVGMGLLDEIAQRETAGWTKRRRRAIETPSLVGQTVGSYRITRVLGEGGVGVVYCGEHPRIGTRVAIKVLHDDFLDSQEMVASFVREAKAANAIASPHIVRVIDFGTLEDGRDYAVMEHLEGRPLDAVLAENGTLPVSRVIRIVRQVAEAMAAAHAVGIVHRDLKPENLFLEARPDAPDGSDFVRILDFGIAKLADPDGSGEPAQANTVLGTPIYCAPEQANGGHVGPAADIYALGAVAYELLTGRTVFQGSVVEVLVAKMTREAPELVCSDVPPAFAALIRQMLERDPDWRPATMTEIQARIASLARTDAPGDNGTMPPLETEIPHLVRTRFSRRAKAAIGATGVVFATIVAAWLVTGRTIPHSSNVDQTAEKPGLLAASSSATTVARSVESAAAAAPSLSVSVPKPPPLTLPAPVRPKRTIPVPAKSAPQGTIVDPFL